MHARLQRRRTADGGAERSHDRARVRAAVGATAEPRRSATAPTSRTSSLSPDGRTIAASRPRAGSSEILDVPSLRHRARLPDSETLWDFLRFTPDGRYLMGASWKGWARLWSTKTYKPVGRRIVGHAGRVDWMSMSPNGRTLATGGPDGTLRLWDLRTAAGARRPRCRGCPTGSSSRSSAPTAPTCSRSTATAPDARTAGMCARRPGPATRARSPGARSHGRNGAMRSQAATTTRPVNENLTRPGRCQALCRLSAATSASYIAVTGSVSAAAPTPGRAGPAAPSGPRGRPRRSGRAARRPAGARCRRSRPRRPPPRARPRRRRAAPGGRARSAASSRKRAYEPAQVRAARRARVDRGHRARDAATVGEDGRPALGVARVGGHPRPLAPRRQRERRASDAERCSTCSRRPSRTASRRRSSETSTSSGSIAISRCL